MSGNKGGRLEDCHFRLQDTDAAKAMGLQFKKDAPGLDTFTKTKLQSGACIAFGRGMAVNPEISKPPLTCVRPSGGLDCYWVADSLVDLNPPQPETNRPTRGGNHRR